MKDSLSLLFVRLPPKHLSLTKKALSEDRAEEDKWVMLLVNHFVEVLCWSTFNGLNDLSDIGVTVILIF